MMVTTQPPSEDDDEIWHVPGFSCPNSWLVQVPVFTVGLLFRIRPMQGWLRSPFSPNHTYITQKHIQRSTWKSGCCSVEQDGGSPCIQCIPSSTSHQGSAGFTGSQAQVSVCVHGPASYRRAADRTHLMHLILQMLKWDTCNLAKG